VGFYFSVIPSGVIVWNRTRAIGWKSAYFCWDERVVWKSFRQSTTL